MKPPREYFETGVDMPPRLLNDATYAAAIESMVIVCVDIVIINRERREFSLAWRKSQPFEGWWVIGGRVLAGEKLKDAVTRKFGAETCLKLPSSRFDMVGLNRYVMAMRKQVPTHRGSDTLAFVHTVELDANELRRVAAGLDDVEYDHKVGLRSFDRLSLSLQNVHPVLLDIYDLVFPA